MKRKSTTQRDASLIMGEDFVYKADDAVIACRAKGHNFPKIDFGKLRDGKQTRGARIEPVKNSDKPERKGAYQMVETCRDCGAERIETTLAGGYLADASHYDYDYSKAAGGQYLVPKGARIPRRDFKQEYVRRAVEALTFS